MLKSKEESHLSGNLEEQKCSFGKDKYMDDKQIRIDNLDKLHTTKLGTDRIRKNLRLETMDVVDYCKSKITDENCIIYKQGKNWYCEIDKIKFTINSNSYTIITAHIIK